MQDTRRPLTALSTALLMAVSPMVFCGCATTLVPGGGTTDDTLDLTTARVIPGVFFGVRHDSIKNGDTVKVRFVGSNGFDITVETTADSDGETRVAAPPLINMTTGAFETGDVMVSIEGITGERTLLLDELPVLEGWTRGELMTAVLDQSIADLVNATANTGALGNEFPTVPVDEDINNMTTAMNEIKALRDELANSGELEFQLADGTATTLSGDEIDTLERYLAGILLGASQEMDRLSGTAKTNGTLPQSKVLGSSTRVGFSRQDFQNFQDSLERGVKGGSVLLAGVAVGVGLVSLFGAGPVAAVAAAAGVAIAGVTAVHAAATSTAVRASSRALLDDAGEKFDAAQFAMEQGFNIGLNFLGGIPGRMGQLFTSASTYLSARDGYENMADIKCETEGNRIRQSQLIEFCSLRDGSGAVSDDNADDTDPDGEGTPGDGDVPGNFNILTYINSACDPMNPGATPLECGGINGTAVDPVLAEIQLAGSPAQPTIRWDRFPGVFSILVTEGGTALYGIVGQTSPDADGDTDTAPFSFTSVVYGSFGLPNTEPNAGLNGLLGPADATALVPGPIYSITVFTLDGQRAILNFQINP